MKKILALVLALIMTMSMAAISSSAAELSDVDSATYSEAINVVSGLGIINGYADGTFRPQADLTRGAATKFVSIAKLGATVANALPGDTSFSDVAATSTFAPYVAYCVENGIVNGYGLDSFRPDGIITREQFATILYRYAKDYKGYAVSVGEDTNILSYTDAFSISDYAFPALQWACGAGLMNGSGDALMPGGFATRAQAAALLHRFCQLYS